MLLMVNNLGGLSFLELGIIADAAIRCLGELNAETGTLQPLELDLRKATREDLVTAKGGLCCLKNLRAGLDASSAEHLRPLLSCP